jgi:hypothetical protein
MQTFKAAVLPWCSAVGRLRCVPAIFVVLLLLALSYGCKDQITGPELISPVVKGPAPLLKDSIPYALLGSGRLAFKRYTPFDGDAFYVLDPLHNASTGIAV